MFSAFISKSFVDNFASEQNKKHPHFINFVLNFLSKLNLDKIYTDYDFTDFSGGLFYELCFKSLRNEAIAPNIRINKPLEYLLCDGSNELKKIISDSDTEIGPEERKIYFVHLSQEIIKSFPDLQNKAIISSASFDDTYRNFLLDGYVSRQVTHAEFLKGKIELNPWSCPSCIKVLIDEPYLLDKKLTDKLDVIAISKRIKNILKSFIRSNDSRSKTIIFHIPLFLDENRRLSWNDKEKGILKNEIAIIIKSICKNVQFEIIFHNLESHARFVLTNRHFFLLSGGFDFNKKTEKTLKTTNDYIKYSSIYLLENNSLLSGFYNNRIKMTAASNHFPY